MGLLKNNISIKPKNPEKNTVGDNAFDTKNKIAKNVGVIIATGPDVKGTFECGQTVYFCNPYTHNREIYDEEGYYIVCEDDILYVEKRAE